MWKVYKNNLIKRGSKKIKGVKEFFVITTGALLVAIGVYFFKFPNNFSTGGVSGISVILGAYFPSVTPGKFLLVINVALLSIGFLFFGRSFGLKTVYCSIVLSGTVYILENLFPVVQPLTNQPFLELIYSVLFPAVGSAMLFNTKASTGGTDIVAMILKKYTSLNIGKALLITDCIIVLISFNVFGVETGLLSLLGLLTKALVIDNVIESINLSKYFTIITQKPSEIIRYINNELNRGATICECKGVFSNGDKAMILSVLSRAQAVQLKRYIKNTDPHSFIVISNTSDIIGKGFRELF